MFIETIYGLLFAAALSSALLVVLSPNAVYNALFLVGTMISIAGLFLLMNAQLAGAFQLIVYAGAIMVLFLFVIMLLNIREQSPPLQRRRHMRLLGLGFAAAFVAQMAMLLARFAGADNRELAANYSLANPPGIGIAAVGRILQTEYIYAFAMTSVLLLVAMIGAVVMARRHLIQGVRDTARQPVDGKG
jgi:NADH:ubiquinone oxidoreductase subunit 6 (subunit J)